MKTPIQSTRCPFPRIALPRIALPRIALPRIALPRITLPRITLSRIVLPRIALSRITLSLITLSLITLSLMPIACEPSSSSSVAIGRPLRFVDRSAASGVDFTCVSGTSEKDYILEVNGGGVALFDADGDGDLDAFFVCGARFDDDPRAASEPAPSDRLYRNDGGWRFTDITKAAGLEESAWGCGVAVADADNDGDLDLFVTNYGPDVLWLNDGGGRFTRAPDGPSDEGWGASCAFVDYDRDGLADLFVVRYLVFDKASTAPRERSSCLYKGEQILCGPVGFPEATNLLYKNLGGGKFADVSVESGIAARSGYGLGVAIGDYDADGWPDIYVAADTTENLLFRNRGDGSFEEIGLRAGVALSDLAIAQAGMGVEFAFVRGADREDLFVTNFEDDDNTYYLNEGDGFFSEATTQMGLAAACHEYLGWACLFVDFDFDRDLDLFIAQGHVVPQVDRTPRSKGYRQPNKLFLFDAGRFRDRTPEAGPGFAVVKSSRGAAAGDLDGDGDVDLAVNEIDERATLLENDGPPRGHWIGLRLRGTTSNRAAIGAVARVTAGGLRQARRVASTSGYASHAELVLRFGLGAAERVERIEVTWPDGAVENFSAGAVDRVVEIVEGGGLRGE